MSKIKDVLIDIQSMLASGFGMKDIADMLSVPLEWVIQEEQEMANEFSDWSRESGVDQP